MLQFKTQNVFPKETFKNAVTPVARSKDTLCHVSMTVAFAGLAFFSAKLERPSTSLHMRVNM